MSQHLKEMLHHLGKGLFLSLSLTCTCTCTWRWAAWSEADPFPLDWTKASLQQELHDRSSETKSNTATIDSTKFSVFSTKSLQSVLQMPHSIYKRTIRRGQRKDEFLYLATGFGSNSEFAWICLNLLMVATEKQIILIEKTLVTFLLCWWFIYL